MCVMGLCMCMLGRFVCVCLCMLGSFVCVFWVASCVGVCVCVE